MGIDENALRGLFGMKSLMLFDKDHGSTHTHYCGKQDESHQKAKNNIASQEG